VEQEQETPGDSASNALEGGDDGSYLPWKEQLESLVSWRCVNGFFLEPLYRISLRGKEYNQVIKHNTSP
jgi:hypothetical protein